METSCYTINETLQSVKIFKRSTKIKSQIPNLIVFLNWELVVIFFDYIFLKIIDESWINQTTM